MNLRVQQTPLSLSHHPSKKELILFLLRKELECNRLIREIHQLEPLEFKLGLGRMVLSLMGFKLTAELINWYNEIMADHILRIDSEETDRSYQEALVLYSTLKIGKQS